MNSFITVTFFINCIYSSYFIMVFISANYSKMTKSKHTLFSWKGICCHWTEHLRTQRRCCHIFDSPGFFPKLPVFPAAPGALKWRTRCKFSTQVSSSSTWKWFTKLHSTHSTSMAVKNSQEILFLQKSFTFYTSGNKYQAWSGWFVNAEVQTFIPFHGLQIPKQIPFVILK